MDDAIVPCAGSSLTSATFFAIILAIVALIAPSSAGIQIILTLIFPPMFYTFFTKGLAAWENVPASPNILHRSPRGDAPILGLLVIAIVSSTSCVRSQTQSQIDIFVFPLLATWLESRVYGVRPPDYISFFRRKVLRKTYPDDRAVPEGSAVEIEHIRKEYPTKLLGIFGRKKPVVAIEDLSFSIPKGEIFCLVRLPGSQDPPALIVSLGETEQPRVPLCPPSPNSCQSLAARSGTPRICTSVSRPRRTCCGMS